MIGVPDEAGGYVLFVSILVVTVALWAATGTAAAQSAPDCSTVSYDGDGTEANPYEVSNVDQIQCISAQGLNANYVQVSDIDASGTSAWNDGRGFNPIGEFDEASETVSTQFIGAFDGKNHDITGLEIDRANESAVGLFGVIGSAGKIKRASVTDADINGSKIVGGLVGENLGTVSNSYANASVNGSTSVGGLVGFSTGKISGSYANVSVNASENVGGLVGVNSGKISESYATGEVNGTGSVGGLVGANAGMIEESYANVSVSAKGIVGGLVGSNNVAGGKRGGTIEKSYATGEVSGSHLVGGLVGISDGTITKSYATGSVNGSNISKISGRVGGLVGYNNDGTITESYAAGEVSGPRFVGGLVGRNVFVDESNVTESYWDVKTTGLSTSDGNDTLAGTGLTTPEMTGSAARNNMRGFDFTSTWETVSGDYPILKWQTDGDWGTNASGSDSNGNGGGDEASDGESEGNSGGDGGNASAGSNSTESGGQRLPGFTTITALLTLLSVVAAATRRRKK